MSGLITTAPAGKQHLVQTDTRINAAVKIRGQWTGVNLTPTNGKPTINLARQVAKRFGLTRKQAALLLLDAVKGTP